MERDGSETVARRPVAAEGNSLSQIGAEFAAGGAGRMPSPGLVELAQKLDQLIRDNLDLQQRLALEEEAHAGTSDRLDGAYRRIQELTEELAEALHQVEVAEQEFTNFRAAYARALEACDHDALALRSALGEAQQALDTAPFRAFLTGARLTAERAPTNPVGTGSGRLPAETPHR
jgi:DNA repair exonuclease SbcCD ATPase subunit